MAVKGIKPNSQPSIEKTKNRSDRLDTKLKQRGVIIQRNPALFFNPFAMNKGWVSQSTTQPEEHWACFILHTLDLYNKNYRELKDSLEKGRSSGCEKSAMPIPDLLHRKAELEFSLLIKN